MKDLFDALSGLPTNSVLRERVLLLVEQKEAVEERARKAEEKVAQLEEQLRECHEELVQRTAAQEFTEHAGALFKRGADGNYARVVYCPNCHGSCYSLENFLPFKCSGCGWVAPFNGQQLSGVMDGLPRGD